MPEVMISHSINVWLPHNYRLIRKSDIGKKFISEDRKMRDYPLSYFYSWSRDDNNIVIVKESGNGDLDGIIMFRLVPGTAQPDKIVVEMLARNFAIPGSSGTGHDLLKILENYIAIPLHIKIIEIEAVKSLEEYYKSFGYERINSYFDTSWKEIVNMEKRIQ
ncbi:GNAT family N-acetyltransferase [Ferroplasma sp.]|uniref:GNAT family N-acetyltransferase n=1 Tax=Ferroplasma sp. TaxID=2591003 RepID=UPI00307F64E8